MKKKSGGFNGYYYESSIYILNITLPWYRPPSYTESYGPFNVKCQTNTFSSKGYA